ncbi:hypothetical protein IKG33_02880 [Candidatus Saccharibacteria bacterium]|nr:hypothetical protein [Candidatus Saccharibacteria bacterium]
MIDIHAHILPGIDDGAVNLTESLEILRWLGEQGVTDVIMTPHYVHETNFVSTRKENLELMEELKRWMETEGIKTRVYLGNEIYIDNSIIKLIDNGKISTLADSNYLLVELPLDDELPNYDDILVDLMDKGYKVILAHPERYMIVHENYEILKSLHEMGVLFQCNLGSIIGKYGKKAQKTMKKMAKDKLVFAFGSDTHHLRMEKYFALAQKKLVKYYNEREMNQLFVMNPKKILAK